MTPQRNLAGSLASTPNRALERRLSGHQGYLDRDQDGAKNHPRKHSPFKRHPEPEKEVKFASTKKPQHVMTYRNTMKELEELGITTSGSESEEEQANEVKKSIMMKNRERLAKNINAVPSKHTTDKPTAPQTTSANPKSPLPPIAKVEPAPESKIAAPSLNSAPASHPLKDSKTEAEKEAERKERQRKAQEAEKQKEHLLKQAMFQELRERNASLSIQKFIKTKGAANTYVHELQQGVHPNMVFLIRQTLKAKEDPNSVQVVAAINSSNKQQITFRIFESTKGGKSPQSLEWYTQDCLEAKGVNTLVFLGSKAAKKLVHPNTNNLKCEKGEYGWIKPSPAPVVIKEEPKADKPVEKPPKPPETKPAEPAPAPAADDFLDDFEDLGAAIKPAEPPNKNQFFESSVKENPVPAEIVPKPETEPKEVAPKPEEPVVSPPKTTSTGSLKRNSLSSARSKKGSTPKVGPSGLRAKGDQTLFKYLYKKEVKPGYSFQVVKDAATMVYLVRAAGVQNGNQEEWVDFVQMKVPITQLPTTDEGFEAMLAQSQFDVDWTDPESPIILHHEEESETSESQPPEDAEEEEFEEEVEGDEEQSDALLSPEVKRDSVLDPKPADSVPVVVAPTLQVEPAPVVEPPPVEPAPVLAAKEPSVHDPITEVVTDPVAEDNLGDDFEDPLFESGPKYVKQSQRCDDDRNIIEVNLVLAKDKSLADQQLIECPYLEDPPDIDYNERMLKEEEDRWDIDEATGKLVPRQEQLDPDQQGDPLADNDAGPPPDDIANFFNQAKKQYEIISQRLETDRQKIEVVLVDLETREAMDIVEVDLVVDHEADIDAEEKKIENEKDNWEYDEQTLKLRRKAAEIDLDAGSSSEEGAEDSQMNFGEKANRYEIVTNRTEENRDRVEVCAFDSKRKRVVATEFVEIPYDENAEPGANEQALDDEKEKWSYDKKQKKLIKKIEDSEPVVEEPALPSKTDEQKNATEPVSKPTEDTTGLISTETEFYEYLQRTRISWIDIFYQADHFNRGTVSAFQLQKSLVKDHKLAKSLATRMIRSLDIDTDGYATIEELMKFENSLPEPIQESAKYKQHDFESKLFMKLEEHNMTWEQLFQHSKSVKHADQDHISTALLVKSLVKMLHVSKSNAKAFLQQMDNDGDGYVTLDEWMKYLKMAAATIPRAKQFYVEQTTASKEAEDQAVQEMIRKQQQEIEHSIQQALKEERKIEANRSDEKAMTRTISSVLFNKFQEIALDMPEGDFDLYVESDFETVDALLQLTATGLLSDRIQKREEKTATQIAEVDDLDEF